jgi:PadR family transcriptional regulator PadR
MSINNNIESQMRKGVLEFCILSILEGNKAYASDIIKQLKDAKLIVVEGTLYPLLTRMKNSGLLSYHWEESKQGPPRKYYSITAKGQQFQKQLSDTWSNMVLSVNTITNKNSENE